MRGKTVALALLSLFVFSGVSYAIEGMRLDACMWKDSNGNNVGRVITFIPPDTPASGGYTCTGKCTTIIWGEDEYGHEYTIIHRAPCVPGPVTDQGGGVSSQECKCD